MEGYILGRIACQQCDEDADGTGKINQHADDLVVGDVLGIKFGRVIEGILIGGVAVGSLGVGGDRDLQGRELRACRSCCRMRSHRAERHRRRDRIS